MSMARTLMFSAAIGLVSTGIDRIDRGFKNDSTPKSISKQEREERKKKKKIAKLSKKKNRK